MAATKLFVSQVKLNWYNLSTKIKKIETIYLKAFPTPISFIVSVIFSRHVQDINISKRNKIYETRPNLFKN